jgi:CHAT domain-containing protein
LFADATEPIRASKRIYAVLDGSLAGAPFETLVCPGETGPLIDMHEIVRVPSAAILTYLRGRPAVAPPNSTILAVAGDAGGLHGARAEVDRLASRYGAVRAVSPDRREFLENLAHFDVIHIASHVHVDGERPWHSGMLISPSLPKKITTDADTTAASSPLALSAADSSQIAAAVPADPFVRASEIANRRLGSRLVVLSACESALGRATMAEGVLGIASSFMSAGTRAVVASLWEVDDRTTAELMQRFYEELARGSTTAAALRRAQLAIRERRPAPFFWAGFVVIGDGDVALSLHPRPDYQRLSGVLVGLTIVLTVPWAVWRRRTRRVRIAP